MRFAILGPIQAHDEHGPVELGHPRQQSVLVALLVDAGRPVTADQLVERVWGEQLPHKPLDALYSHLSRLRKIDGVEILRRQGGYVLDAAPEDVDLHRFHALVRQARGLVDTEAAILLDEALRLWRGEPFGGLDTPWFAALRTQLLDGRTTAQLHHNDVELRRGRHSELVPRLKAAADERPGDERLSGQLMLALYRDGRQGEALTHYDQVRRYLADELGADPGLPLQRLHRQILTRDPAVSATVDHPVPCRLPANPQVFVGRADEHAELDDVATGVVLVVGPGGVGKTSLVVNWAHSRSDRFPDGQLYANLRGFDPAGAPADPAEVLRQFLDALHVLPERIPNDLETRGALFRELTSQRRLLVVLDNARDEEQVRPLLPAGGACLTVVTSRTRLTGLVVAEQAHLVGLRVLAEPDAAALLARRIDRGKLSDDPEAVDELIRFTGGLPLALSVVAAWALAHPTFSLRTLATDLRNEQTRLDALDAGEPTASVRAVISWSYQSLSPAAAKLFRLLAVHPGADIGVHAAAALAGVTTTSVRSSLAELTRNHMTDAHEPGRFRSHDLLRTYAREQVGEDEAAEALGRVMDHYLHTGFAAERQLSPHWQPISLAEPRSSAAPRDFADYDQAVDWFTAEHAAMLAAVDLAVVSGWDTHAWQLPWTLSTFLTRSGRWDLRASTQQIALAAAKRLDDHTAQAAALHLLGRAHSLSGNHPQAMQHLDEALALYRGTGDPTGEAATLFSLGLAFERRGDSVTAMDHTREALRLFKATENQPWTAFCLSALGWYNARLGQDEPAIGYSTKALELLRGVGDRDCEAHVLRTLGHVHHRRADVDLTIKYHKLACDLFQDLGDVYSEAMTADELGDACNVNGDSDAARTAWQRAATLLTALDHPDAAVVRTKLNSVGVVQAR